MKNVTIRLTPETWVRVNLTFHGAKTLALFWRREMEQRIYLDGLGVPNVEIEKLRARLESVYFLTKPRFEANGGVSIFLTLLEFSNILLPEYTDEAPTHDGGVFVVG